MLTAALALVLGLPKGPESTGATAQADRLQQDLRLAEATSAQPIQMTTEVPTPARRRAMDEVLRGAVLRYFKTWTASPEVQLEAIGRHEWRGRYVGFWHLHPPRIASDGYAPGLEPSAEDLAIAVEMGQLLTLVFQPDGFDAYDLAPVSASGMTKQSQARVVRHRSAAWKLRFRRPDR